MTHYVIHRPGGPFPTGTIFSGGPDGLKRCERKQVGKNHWIVSPATQLLLPFRELAPFLLNMTTLRPASHETLEILAFQEATAEIIEPILEERQRKLDPGYSDSWRPEAHRPKDMNEVISDETDPRILERYK